MASLKFSGLCSFLFKEIRMNDLQGALLDAGLTTPQEFEEAKKNQHQDVARLRPDGLDRGRHAIHLHRHRKFGRHCTLVNEAFPLIKNIISLPQVKKVDLGKVRFSWGQGKRGLTIRITPHEQTLRLFINGDSAMQVILVKPRWFEDKDLNEIIH